MSATSQTARKGDIYDDYQVDWVFQIKGKDHLYFKQTTSVDFSPVKAIDQTQKHQKIAQFSILPTFNDDKKFYSYAFITPYHGLDEDSKMLTEHETRVKQYSTQIDSHKILLPKPRHEKPFCSVCRLLYEDYLQHVKSQIHLRYLSKNKYCILTLELIDKFKSKMIAKSTRSSPRLKSRRNQ